MAFGLVALTAAGSAVAAAALGWSVLRTPNPAGAMYSELNGVSCSAESACTAVGGAYAKGIAEGTVAERWNGTRWSLETIPTAGATVAGVSCTSKSVCIAVGYFEEMYRSPKRMLAARWNGTKWSLLKIRRPPGGTESQLYGVSCTSKSACTAVGDYVKDGKTEVTLAERWNGSKWSIQRTLQPAGAVGSGLSDVSCTSKSLCTAVGSFDSSKGPYATLTLAERWNGTRWSLQRIPNATPHSTRGAANALNGISCTSESACTAVGLYKRAGATIRALVERWNATKWSLQTPSRPIDRPSELNGVSCTAINACTAVGFYSKRAVAPSRPMVERWNGIKWSFQRTPNPTGVTGSELDGVSCSSNSVCTAVGDYFKKGSGDLTLAERWNGG